MNNTKIVFYGFRPGPGGISRILLNLMREISQVGIAVHVLLSGKNDASYATLPPNVCSTCIDDRNFRQGANQVAAFLKQHHPTVLLANKDRAEWIAVAARKKARSPVSIVLRVGTDVSHAIGRRHWLQRFIRRHRIRRYYRQADTILAVSSGVAEDLAAMLNRPLNTIRVVANPTLGPAVETLAGQVPAHPWFNDQGPPVILGIGRLAQPKRFDVLIRAFAMARKETPCRLMILGEGKLRDKLTQLGVELGVAADMALPGYVDNPFACLANAGLFVLSSIREGAPNVLIEALATGVSVVSTDCRFGPREILQDGRIAPLVPVDDWQAMAGQMVELLRNPLDPEKLKAAVARFHSRPAARAYLEAMGIPLPGKTTF